MGLAVVETNRKLFFIFSSYLRANRQEKAAEAENIIKAARLALVFRERWMKNAARPVDMNAKAS